MKTRFGRCSEKDMNSAAVHEINVRSGCTVNLAKCLFPENCLNHDFHKISKISRIITSPLPPFKGGFWQITALFPSPFEGGRGMYSVDKKNFNRISRIYGIFFIFAYAVIPAKAGISLLNAFSTRDSRPRGKDKYNPHRKDKYNIPKQAIF